jgi:ribonuclease HI
MRKLSTKRPLLPLSAASLLPSSAPPRPSSLSNNIVLSTARTTQARTYASKTSADDVIEEIQEQYATARDEFEIATEETEKKSIYAADDRAAAREELDNLKEMYGKALEGEDGEEVKRRIGQRIRELDHAVQALEQSALED